MRILLSGAAGFLGSHLCDRLITEGSQVIGLDNFLTGSPVNIAHLKRENNFSLIEGDVCETVSIQGKLDAVLHFASPASPNPNSPYGYPQLPLETLKAGSLGTLNLLNLAEKKKARFILASTSEIYGDPHVHPQKETYNGNVNPVGLRSMYDEAKRFSEALTMAFFRSRGTDTRIVRIFNTYGPRMRLDDGRVVPSFIQQALNHQPLTIFGRGRQTRSFCFVDDLVDGILRLLNSNEHFPINIGNPVETSILDFAKLINLLTGNSAGYCFQQDMRLGNDPERRCPDIRMAKSKLGWEPHINLEEGLSRTIAFYKNGGS
jgi:dTDP-glucose 4,6-dehydratase